MALPATLLRFLVDDMGQDLVEYALLTGFVGIAGAAAWLAIQDSLAAAYTGFDGDTQNLWEPPAPQATGS